MSLVMADFDAAYEVKIPSGTYYEPVCKPEQGCFPASHVVPQSEYLINTYLTRPDRSYNQPGGSSVAIREGMLCRNN